MPADSRTLVSDAERLGRWVDEHAPAVLGFLRLTLRREDVCEDLLQETLCRAWEARGRYVDTGHERAYLLTIADRLACDRLRRNGREVVVDEQTWAGLEPASDGSDPTQGLLRDESARQVEAALDNLSETQRRVLLLRYYGDLSFQEIADTTGWPLNTVLSHSRRGLLALRSMFIEDLS